MFVVTVKFTAKPESAEDFQAALLRQAANSRENEPGCLQFDVSVDPQQSHVFFLYEVYTDAAAFDAHRETPHFAQFRSTINDWIAQRDFHAWTSIAR